ncbi:VOC family protein [Aurantimonas sp. NFXS3]|uniref:VOC family protein n=1 Tax=Aurantimonas sp. NFXS3 TaxID=2818434 RepID=UPI003BA2B63B
MSKISPCLWFDTEAEAAARFYVETFRACGQTASLGDTLLYGEAFPDREGSVLTIGFTLAGQDFIALNGGSSFKITPAVSLFVSCADQAKIDAFWERFLDGGTVQQCGWDHRPVRPVLADRAGRPQADDPRSGQGAGRPRHAGDDGHGETGPGVPRSRISRRGLTGARAGIVTPLPAAIPMEAAATPSRPLPSHGKADQAWASSRLTFEQ